MNLEHEPGGKSSIFWQTAAILAFLLNAFVAATAHAGLTQEYDRFEDRGKVVFTAGELVLEADTVGKPGEGYALQVIATRLGHPRVPDKIIFLLDDVNRLTLTSSGPLLLLDSDAVTAIGTAKRVEAAIYDGDERPVVTFDAAALADYRRFVSLIRIGSPEADAARAQAATRQATRGQDAADAEEPADGVAIYPGPGDAPPDLPRPTGSVVYLVDASGSMTGHPWLLTGVRRTCRNRGVEGRPTVRRGVLQHRDHTRLRSARARRRRQFAGRR